MSVFPCDHAAADVLGAMVLPTAGHVAGRRHPLQAMLGVADRLAHWLRRELGRGAQTECGFRVLAYLDRSRDQPVTSATIASHLGLPPASVAVILGRLEVSGLVAQRHGTSHRKPPAIVATPAGRKAYHGACVVLSDALARLTAGISQRELAAFEHTCDRLEEALQRPAPAPIPRARPGPRATPRRRPADRRP